MRSYEVMFIAAPQTADDELQKITSQLQSIVTEQGGTVTKVDQWGRRKLAYPIKKFEEGIYTILNIEGTGNEIAEVDRRLRVTDAVIRHLVVRTDEELRRAEKLRAKRKPLAHPHPMDEELEEFELVEMEDEEFEDEELEYEE